MMMLSSSEAVSSAKATAIISDMRNLKTAFMAYLADNIDDSLAGYTDPNRNFQAGSEVFEKVLTYLNNGKDFPHRKSYILWGGKDDNTWYIECCLEAGKERCIAKGAELAAIKKKLAGRAKSVGLLNEKISNADAYDGKTGASNGSFAYMRIQ